MLPVYLGQSRGRTDGDPLLERQAHQGAAGGRHERAPHGWPLSLRVLVGAGLLSQRPPAPYGTARGMEYREPVRGIPYMTGYAACASYRNMIFPLW
ncbi:hypothetical protein ACIGW8_20530 [Streptomyces sioyaensis]|uniref:hypothetical protein n=1 Tax=Streptomyces sioyaensis TaxID=67364 RepID=UPI0037CF8B38